MVLKTASMPIKFRYFNLVLHGICKLCKNNGLHILVRYYKTSLIGHFTVMDGSEAGVDLVLIQSFLLYYVNQVILMLTSIFQGQFP